MIPTFPTARLTTPDRKLIQLDWNELETVYLEAEGDRTKYMVRIAGEDFEVTSLDWAFACRVLE